jgi:hypothetical protein
MNKSCKPFKRYKAKRDLFRAFVFMAAVVIACTASCVAWAKEPTTQLLLHTNSYHFDRHHGFNESNPGIGLLRNASDNTFIATGIYYNSVRRMTVYAAAAWQPLQAGSVKAGLMIGGATGYAMPVAPIGAVVVSASVNVFDKPAAIHAVVLPDVKFKGQMMNYGAVGFMLQVPFN